MTIHLKQIDRNFLTVVALFVLGVCIFFFGLNIAKILSSVIFGDSSAIGQVLGLIQYAIPFVCIYFAVQAIRGGKLTRAMDIIARLIIVFLIISELFLYYLGSLFASGRWW